MILGRLSQDKSNTINCLGRFPYSSEIVMYKKEVIIHEKTRRLFIALPNMNMHNPGTSVHMFKFVVLQNHRYPCLDKLNNCLHTILLELRMN